MTVTHGPSGLNASRNFWDRLEDEERRLLRDIAELVVYEPGEPLITVGEDASTAMVIQSGWVKITNIYPGQDPDAVWLRTLGDLVGESAYIGTRRIATVTALTEVRALVVAADAFVEFLDLCPRAQRAFHETQRDRQIESDRKCIELGRTNSDQRLAALLLRLFDRAGRVDGVNGDRRLVLELPLSQKELAQLIRVTCKTVERTLKDWRRRRIIVTDPRKLTLLDESALRRIASLPDESGKREEHHGPRRGRHAERGRGPRGPGME
jgi:CRP/FNR family cyclic AMP-dependent transcriptional regulator